MMTSEPAGVDGPSVDTVSCSSSALTRWGIRGVVTLAILWVLHTAAQYFAVGMDQTAFMRHKLSLGFEPSAGWRFLLGVHVATAVVAMVIGSLSIVLAAWSSWSWHRLSGRTYGIAVVVSAVAGLPLALFATGGVPAVIGFLLLDGVWLATTAIAYRHARGPIVDRHQIWAVRSYAVTFANLTLHLLTTCLTSPLGSRSSAYSVAVLLCWPINLLVAESVLFARKRWKLSID